jgi:hypothetical protein
MNETSQLRREIGFLHVINRRHQAKGQNQDFRQSILKK